MTGTASTPKSDVAQAIASVYKTEWGRIVAILIRLLGDFDLAEEAAQEAFAAAVNQWETSGIPDLPRAWIIRTARYKEIDRLRRRTRLTEKLEWYAASGLIPSSKEPTYGSEKATLQSGVRNCLR
ncbi:sigma factor [Leptolyngbya sp. UWPOB_LEPTO1]|uniref:sigma factor n=1 Tax=Leptolyngbya sp. UWPOB_LEPTO1 TaxID=2815653 RepID=UPI00257B1BF9|nr:sigma factor [Leptolyngbya sp. UWPOB_LEPTO1]